jgi:hypothetical protein
MAVRQQQRRGTAAQWTSANPILSPGEIGFEIDTNKFKIGDGTNRWATLTYFTADAAAALEELIDGAPGLLDTLNELAAAVGDDANFFATVNTNIATAKTEAISAASADATSKANAAKTAAEATASADATSKANAAQSAAEATASADATSKANAVSSDLTDHENATEAHGATGAVVGTNNTQTLTNKTLTSPVINGATVGGHIVPSVDNTYDLGSPTNMWKDIYVGPGSLYVNGQKVLQDESGAIVVSADINENLGLRTSGSGNIELDPTGTGVVNIKGPLVMQAGANVTSADGNSVTFGGSIAADSVTSKTANTDLSLSGNGTGKVYVNDNAEVGGNLTVTGNLSVGGTVTTINSETISLADNIIDLNSNFTTGAPTENSGIRVVRGDESNVQVRWNETADKWQFTNDGSVFFDIAPAQSPTFTGTPLAPTAGVGTDTTQVATTAFVKAAIQDIASLNLVLDGGGV